MTAHYTTETAWRRFKKGACDYLNKPISIPALRARVEKLLEDARARSGRWIWIANWWKTCRFESMIGRSLDHVGFIRAHPSCGPSITVPRLITGPTGTGKDLVARAVAQSEPAREGRFVTCNWLGRWWRRFSKANCSDMLKGALPERPSDKMGLFEFAHGGTLFLDENPATCR